MRKAVKQNNNTPVKQSETTNEVVVLASRSGDEARARRPDPEVKPKVKRRVFTTKFKLRILKEADNCHDQGELGALLRREGLYASHLTTWRRQRDRGELTAQDSRRGPKTADQSTLADMVADLKRKNAQLENELARARAVVEVQKKISELLGLTVQGVPSIGGES